MLPPHLPSPNTCLLFHVQTGAQVRPGKEALLTEATVMCSFRHDIPCCPGRPAGPAGPGNGLGKKRLCHTSRVTVLERAEEKAGPGYTCSFLTGHGTVAQRGQLPYLRAVLWSIWVRISLPGTGPQGWAGLPFQILSFNDEGLLNAPSVPSLT